MHSKFLHLPPDESGPSGNELAPASTVSKSADVEGGEADRGQRPKVQGGGV